MKPNSYSAKRPLCVQLPSGANPRPTRGFRVSGRFGLALDKILHFGNVKFLGQKLETSAVHPTLPPNRPHLVSPKPQPPKTPQQETLRP